jgi:osmotically-inducible protein OsmY
MARIIPIAFAAALFGSIAACGPQSATGENPEKFTRQVKEIQSPDAELGGKVKQALHTSGVEVSAADGVVTLYGTVDAPAEPHRLAMLAMSIEGVRSVVNNLVVTRRS